jgi:hypothetical protein
MCYILLIVNVDNLLQQVECGNHESKLQVLVSLKGLQMKNASNGFITRLTQPRKESVDMTVSW